MKRRWSLLLLSLLTLLNAACGLGLTAVLIIILYSTSDDEPASPPEVAMVPGSPAPDTTDRWVCGTPVDEVTYGVSTVVIGDDTRLLPVYDFLLDLQGFGYRAPLVDIRDMGEDANNAIVSEGGGPYLSLERHITHHVDTAPPACLAVLGANCREYLTVGCYIPIAPQSNLRRIDGGFLDQLGEFYPVRELFLAKEADVFFRLALRAGYGPLYPEDESDEMGPTAAARIVSTNIISRVWDWAFLDNPGPRTGRLIGGLYSDPQYKVQFLNAYTNNLYEWVVRQLPHLERLVEQIHPSFRPAFDPVTRDDFIGNTTARYINDTFAY